MMLACIPGKLAGLLTAGPCVPLHRGPLIMFLFEASPPRYLVTHTGVPTGAVTLCERYDGHSLLLTFKLIAKDLRVTSFSK